VSQKIQIIGSGFNALATAYLLKKKGHELTVSFERNIKGVLGSVEIEGEKFDLGYQFFDGLDEETCSFINNMFSGEDLHDFKYGASAFANNFFYKNHASTYWPSYGKVFVTKAIIFYLIRFLKQLFIREKNEEYKNLADYYNQLPPKIREITKLGCEKNFQISSEYLSVNAYQMSTITQFRQTLFGDKISNFLKNKSKYFDKVLASRRKSNNKIKDISLYPKNKNMEYIADKLIQKLINDGVKFEEINFNKMKIEENKNNIKINNENFDKVILTTNLNNIKKIFSINNDQNHEHYVSQIFIYFTLEKLNYNYQYTQINDINMYCSRISNCSLYSKETKEKNKVLIAEIPLKNDNKLWDNDQELAKIAWDEIIKCGIVEKSDNYKSVRILKVPKTFAVPKINFFKDLNKIESNLRLRFKRKIDLIGQGIFTRHLFIKELLKKIKNYE